MFLLASYSHLNICLEVHFNLSIVIWSVSLSIDFLLVALGRGWGQEEKGPTEDEMAGWHHRLNGHEFE